MDYIRDEVLENVQVLYGKFRNFSGVDKGYGPQPMGKGYFNVRIPDDVASALIEKGWNVKIHAPRDEEDEGFYFIKVNFGYRNREGNPVKNMPEIYRISDTTHKKVLLDENSVKTLDGTDILRGDIEIRANTNWGDGSIAAATLKKAYFLCSDDYLSNKYSDEEYPFN